MFLHSSHMEQGRAYIHWGRGADGCPPFTYGRHMETGVEHSNRDCLLCV